MNTHDIIAELGECDVCCRPIEEGDEEISTRDNGWPVSVHAGGCAVVDLAALNITTRTMGAAGRKIELPHIA